MPKRLIVIAVEGSARALDALEERVDAVVETATMEGGITALTSEAVLGAAATRAAEALQDAAAGRTRRGTEAR